MIRTLEEAIEHAKEVAENWKSQLVNCVSEEGRNKCLECAKEHEQLAEWLTELKEYREGNRTCQNCKYDMSASTAYPCNDCRNSHPNMFEWKESEATNE